MQTSTYKYFIIVGVLLILGLIYNAHRKTADFSDEFPQKIANFTALDINGQKTDFESVKGKATLLVLTASWCPACKAEIPFLKKIHDELSPLGLKIVMISEDDNIKIAKKYKKQANIPWDMLHWNYDLMNQLGNPRYIPVSFVIDESGDVQRVDVGPMDESKVYHELKSILK